MLVLLLRRLLGHRTGSEGTSRQVLRHCRDEFQMEICASAAYLTQTSVTRLAENIGKFHWLVISFVGGIFLDFKFVSKNKQVGM